MWMKTKMILLTNKLRGAESFEKMIIAQLVKESPIFMEP